MVSDACFPMPARNCFVPALVTALLAASASAQPICHPWGNVAGIHLDGEPIAFESSLRAVHPDWSGVVQSSKYNWEGRQTYTFDDTTTTCSHFLQGTQLNYTTKVTATGRGAARVDLQVALGADLAMAGAFFCLDLPGDDYTGATFELIGAEKQPISTLTDASGQRTEKFRVTARGFRAVGAKRTIEVIADTATEMILRQDFVDQPAYLNDPHPRLKFVEKDPHQKVANFQVYFSVLPGTARQGATAQVGYQIRVDGSIDREPATLVLDARNPGRLFAGVSGNLRMQYPELDPQVVDYCLQNLDVTWGRIAFPWSEWQPEESGDQAAKVLAGGMTPSFYAQIEMARTLAARRIPIIVSVWSPPKWAVDASVKLPKGVKLDPRKLEKSAQSVANWLTFLKKNYGVEVALFSFNETDYGVEVHQDSEEHALANRTFGAAFAARGLVTKMLLGDTGACTVDSNKIVLASQNDPSIHPYLGAIAFHTYHGVTDRDLKAWAESARITNLPLLVTEGGPDSAAHRYPLIFVTPWFAQLEIDEYIRSAAACQPNTIMPWQFNADYSLLAGGGIYGDHGPLRPTQRFWSVKQLGTLSHAFWLPISANRPNIHCAALGDLARGAYAIHMTNNGASRMATVTGLPDAVKTMRVVVTDGHRGMQHVATKGVVNGKVSFLLEAQTFTSLFSE